MKLWILTPIAERDVHFYLATAQRLKSQQDCKILFLSFFQPGNDLIRKSGFEVLDPYQHPAESLPSLWTQAYVQKHFQTPPLGDLLLHEKLTFGISTDEEVIRKFLHFFWSLDHILASVEAKFPAHKKCILQELAGFVGPLSLFYVGLKRGWTNWMTEPSFFKGRIHFLKNDLYLQVPACAPTAKTESQVHQYLQKALEQKVVVAAAKDAHHYKDMGFAKVFNLMNFQKLSKKLYFKYIKGEKQEFDHIWNHARRYLIMLKNRMENAKAYSHLESLPLGKKIFYFPFHVQLDFALTIRCPQWLDQLALIEKLLLHLPEEAILVAKEHPASIGCLDQTRLQRVLKNPQFRLLHPQINSHDIMDRASGVVTINSKVGAEAMTKGLPVLSFGKAFYTERGYTEHFSDWKKLRPLFESWTHREEKPGSPNPEWIRFLNCVWQSSEATELYDLNPSNVANFAEALQRL